LQHEEPQFNDFNPTPSLRRTVMQDMKANEEGTALRELSLDEAEMVGGGFSWGGLLHGVEHAASGVLRGTENRARDAYHFTLNQIEHVPEIPIAIWVLGNGWV
jgi:hypothetical protein